MGDLNGLLADPDFQSLDLPTKRATLARVDPDFGGLSDGDFQAFLARAQPSAPVPSWGSQFLSSLSDSAQNLIPNAMKIFDQPPRLSMLHDFDTALTDQLSRAVHGDPEALGSLAAQAPLALGGMEFDPAALAPSAGGAADALFSGLRGVKNLGAVGKGVITGAAKSAHEAPLLTIGGDLMSRALGRGDLGAAVGAIPPIVGGIRGGIEAARGLGRSALEDIPSASTRSVPGKLFTIPGRSESIPSTPLSPAPVAPPGEPMPTPTTPYALDTSGLPRVNGQAVIPKDIYKTGARTTWGKNLAAKIRASQIPLDQVNKWSAQDWDAHAKEIGLNPSSPDKIAKAREFLGLK